MIQTTFIDELSPQIVYIDLSAEELSDITSSSHRFWKFAKTMPKYPHWYLMRTIENDALFSRFVMHIRKHGHLEHFCWFHGSTKEQVCSCSSHKTFVKFDYQSYTYWTMGYPLLPLLGKSVADTYGTRLINRASID